MALLRRFGLWLAGLLVIIGFAIMGSPKRRQREAESQRDRLLLDKSARSKALAQKAGERADRLQNHAADAAKAGQAAIDKVGTDNEDMRSILDTWRSDSV
jgi:hypothetical protein